MKTKTLSIILSDNGLSYYELPVRRKIRERYTEFDNSANIFIESVKQTVAEAKFAKGRYSDIQILLDTTDSVYVPKSILNADNATAYLKEAGVSIATGDKVVTTSPVGEVATAIAFDGAVIEYISNAFDIKPEFYSPLQENVEIAESLKLSYGTLIVNIAHKNIYITSYNDTGKMMIAEVYPYYSVADIIYYLHNLTTVFNSNEKIYIFGIRSGNVAKELKKYFRKRICVL